MVSEQYSGFLMGKVDTNFVTIRKNNSISAPVA